MYKDFQNCNRVIIEVCYDDVIIAYNYFIDMFGKYHQSTIKSGKSEINILVFKPDEIHKFNNIVDNLNMSTAVLNTELNVTLQLTNKI